MLLDSDDILEGTANLYDKVVSVLSGFGISVSGTYPNFTITNAAPDVAVSILAGSGISVSGTYPNFTIASTVSTADKVSKAGDTMTGELYLGTGNPADGLLATRESVMAGMVTGTLSGMEFTNTASDFTIAAGRGQVIDHVAAPEKVQLVNLASPVTVVDAFPTSETTYVGILANGTVHQQIAPFTNDDRRNIIFIGVLAKNTATQTIIASSTLHTSSYDVASLTFDLLDALGPICNGLTFYGNANLTLGRKSGRMMRQGAAYNSDKASPNRVPMSEQPTTQFSTTCRNGNNSTFSLSGLQNALIVNRYDDGTATSTGIPNGIVNTNQWQAIRLFLSPNTYGIFQYGTAVYNSLAEAQQNFNDEVFYEAPITTRVAFR